MKTSKKRKLAYIKEKNAYRLKKEKLTHFYKVDLCLSDAEIEYFVKKSIEDFLIVSRKKWKLLFFAEYTKVGRVNDDFVKNKKTLITYYKVK
jgi:hypothetical protein